MNLLSNSYIEDAEFKNLDLSHGELKFKEIVETTFEKCVFTETFFNECRFRNCTFVDCDLTMAHVKSSSFSSVQFQRCKAIGINWTEATWAKGGFFRLIDFDDCTVNYSTFFGLKLRKMRLTNCIARDVDFGEADLTSSVFSRTDFSGSTFMHTDLTEADFTDARNYSIAAHLNKLKQTKFSLPEALSLLYSLDIVLVDSHAASSGPARRE